MSALCVFLPPAACAAVDPELPVWRVAGGDCAQLAFADAVPATEQVWRLVLPVEAVSVCAVALPTTKARWLEKALPFAVEELLAEDVDLFHLTVGEALGDGRHRVYAVRRDWLAGWLALCGDSAPQRIEIDADLLGNGATQLLCLGERWLLGGSGEVRLAIQAEQWPQVRDLCPQPWVAHLAQGAARADGVDELHEVAQPYAWLAKQHGGNLAQGAFARREASGGLGRWRVVLALFGIWVTLQWGFNLAQGWRLQSEAEHYASANEALYRELFPGDRKLINLRAQFDQHLSEGAGSGQNLLLGLLDQAARAINAEGAQVRVEQLDFNAQRGDVALNLQAQDFAALERLRERLQESGMAVQMGSASREDAGVSARLVIGGNG
ncbi:type II secretion system protein GspL [Pseudomonas sp. PDM14]|uniref:type II secretion system protein GspL n=1 Tax=Pseudomonas sp. PDM14 TaxID=2769288 RepID=UPI0017869E13|nr:type II secretion system protein GspL [Pseudomonas sp. PDM14]MBD9484569.1 type II secretion system protein GspL [Pseudomonas sp. PDM14]